MPLVPIFFYLFLISLPLGLGWHLNNFLLTLFLLSGWRHFKNFKYPKLLLIFLASALLSVFFAFDKGLAIYSFARLLTVILVALLTSELIRGGFLKLPTIFAVLAGSAVFQSLTAFGQFIKQSSLGLGFLGESVLGPDINGVAKIVVDGVKIIRAYGTFSHPNVLAAFLLLGLFSLYYFWLSHDQKDALIYKTAILTSATFIIILGLTLTFSRTAWVIGDVLSVLLVSYYLLNPACRKKAVLVLIILLSIFYFLFSVFRPYIISRVQISAVEPAVTYRLTYNKIGWDLIKNHPLGIGIGNQVLFADQSGLYDKFELTEQWQKQPIHNIYLLIASEVGIVGLIIFFIFLVGLLISNVKFPMSNQVPIYNDQKLAKIIVVVMLSSLVLFGLADHFLWTLHPGRLMLWLVIGIVLAQTKPS